MGLSAASAALLLAAAAFSGLPAATGRAQRHHHHHHHHQAQAGKDPWVRPKADGITAAPHKYNYEAGLGLAIRFLDVQRSGEIESAPGGNMVPWKKNQLLKDGADVGLDLAGGHYEAGNRLKISLSEGYTFARLALAMLYYKDVFEAAQFEGKSAFYWAQRELRWAVEWMLKAYAAQDPSSPVWQSGDRFVIQVGKVAREWCHPPPGDFDCYRRAENIPSAPNCVIGTRKTYVADGDNVPCADGAAETAAALGLAAAVFSGSDAALAERCATAARALHDFATRYPASAADKVWVVKDTYDTTYPQTNLLWASAALAYVFGCGGGSGSNKLCDQQLAGEYLDKAWGWWGDGSTQAQLQVPVANWNNAVYDSAFLMAVITGDQQFRDVLAGFVQPYAQADGSKQITHSPKGMRLYTGNDWSSLRVPVAASYVAILYSSLQDVDHDTQMQAACLARSQLGYVFGDTGRSYVVGTGTNWPKQVSHRDAACSLEEDAAGKCDRPHGPGINPCNTTNYLWFSDRPNPEEATGGIVGGPDKNDKFIDNRNEWTYTEVANDYNVALILALAGMLTAPDNIFTTDCANYVPNYPWANAG